MRFLDAHGREQLATVLGESPEHVISLHALRSGRCRACAIGLDETIRAAVIEPFLTPRELLAFGDDGGAIVALLGEFDEWNCVEVAAPLVDPVADAMMRAFGCEIERYGDVFFAMTSPAPIPALTHPAVRLLKAQDAEFYERCVPAFGDDPIDARRAVEEGPVVAAIVDDVIVSVVEANVQSARYANFTADTLEPYRNRGLVSACAALAAHEVQRRGLTPVWSAGERNFASLRAAHKVGFHEVARWTYLSLRAGKC